MSSREEIGEKLARILVDKRKLPMITDLEYSNILSISYLRAIGKAFNIKFYLDFTDTLMELMISHRRAGRSEILEALKYVLAPSSYPDIMLMSGGTSVWEKLKELKILRK